MFDLITIQQSDDVKSIIKSDDGEVEVECVLKDIREMMIILSSSLLFI